MLEKNKDSFEICIKFRTKLRIPIFDFRLIFLMREDFRIKITISPEKKNRKSGFDFLLGNRCRFQNCPCFCSSIDGF